MMKKLIFIPALILGVLLIGRVSAEECDLACLEKQIVDLEDKRKLSEAATTPLESEVKKLTGQINSIGGQLVAHEKRLEQLEIDINDREEKLAGDYLIMSERVRRFYKRSRVNPLLMVLFARGGANNMTKELTYQQAITDEDKEVITSTTTELIKLEQDVKKLEEDKKSLAALQVRLDAQASFYEGEIAKAKDYQAELASKIADLTARQQEILSAKTGTFQTSVGDVPLADDPASQPGYNPGFSPAFATFSFGAPHFKGMSQYGAFGRAKEGQNAEEILKAYYGSGIELKKDYSSDVTLNVEGYGSYNIEEYVKRIYEMPGSWGNEGGMEALKAQAVAARSYALARGGSICATEACQVFKPEPKGGKWEEAVNATKGWVLQAGGQPFSAMYASTSGGYQDSYTFNGHTTPAFWDTKNGREGWTSQAYEKIAESPWFYKAWYRERSGDSCGRSHPWLNGEEMADILNAWKVLFQGGGDSGRVTPISSCWGGNPYSMGELRDIGGYSSVSSVEVKYGDNGVTAEVRFGTNKGQTEWIKGADFKKAFNLRAPGRIAIKSGLFNIEKK